MNGAIAWNLAPGQDRQQMPPGIGGVRKSVQAQGQRARSSLEHPELKTVRPHRRRPHRRRGIHGAKLLCRHVLAVARYRDDVALTP